jgi:copper homeostasis protein
VAPLLEICVDHVDGARIAEVAGADRVEVCAGLVEGGITPSIGMVRAVLRTVRRVGVQVLIRPRGGDFHYSPAEIEVMADDIAAVSALAKDVTVGFVIGALTAGGEIDVPTTRELLSRCGDAPVTFHKAFDATRDVERSLDVLMELGVGRVLTSGGRPQAVDGVPALAALVRRAGGRIAVMAGGAVRPHNVRSILARTGVPEIHLRATGPVGPPEPAPATPPVDRSKTDHSFQSPPRESSRGSRHSPASSPHQADATSSAVIAAMLDEIRKADSDEP